MLYQFQSNLKQIALLNCATLIWRSPNSGYQLSRLIFLAKGRVNLRAPHYIKELNGEVVEIMNFLTLPQVLKEELGYVVKELAVRIADWWANACENNIFQSDTFGDLLDCVEQMHWHDNGTINDAKLLSSFILTNPSINASLCVDQCYETACRYMLEEHVSNLWGKMCPTMQLKYRRSVTIVLPEQHILAYWECRRNGWLFSGLVRDFLGDEAEIGNRLYNIDHSIEENMLRLSIHEGYADAVRYFWKYLNEEERNRNIVDGAHMAVDGYHFSGRPHCCLNSKYVEICVFLMNHSTAQHREELFESMMGFSASRGIRGPSTQSFRYHLLVMLLSAPPFRNFFVQTFKMMWKYIEADPRAIGYILYDIVFEIKSDLNLGFDIGNNKCRYILQEVWNMIPAYLKKEVARDQVILTALNLLLDINDQSSIRLIMSAPEMVSLKEDLIQVTKLRYEKLIKDDQYELVEKFMDAMTISDAEKKKVKQGIKAYDHFIMGNKFDSLDKLLDWQSDSSEERQLLKSQINCAHLCSKYIFEDRYRSANELLMWRFDTQEERREFVSGFILSDVGISSVDERIKKSSDCKHHEPPERKIETFKRLIHFWIKPTRRVDEIKSKLESCMNLCDKQVQINDYQNFISLMV